MKFLSIAIMCALASAASAATQPGEGASTQNAATQKGAPKEASTNNASPQTGGQNGGSEKKPCVGRTDEECVEPECYKYIGVTYDRNAAVGHRYNSRFLGI
ncbi:hypothetical protein K492DRAFT_195153 [Lichtheimia hyalospora FSU 10163]|nr:hypothetical protein K492DRAFT_195153 [Lichtheimia hyalospora FSU 10163]